MKICYLADSGSVHVQRRIDYIAQNTRHEIHVITFGSEEFGRNIKFHHIKAKIKYPYDLNYLVNIPKIKNLVHRIRPDVLHSYYLTSYGFIGACCRFHPYVISCLGSDILITPRKSILHRLLTVFAVKKADVLTSVSNLITCNLLNLGSTPEKTKTLVFGIDLNVFCPVATDKVPDSGDFLSIRALKPVYNIDMLLNATAE